MAETRTGAAGAICLTAGVLGALSGIALALYPADVPEDRYSYPLTAGAFTAVQVWFFVQHLGLLAGIVTLARVPVHTRATGAGAIVAAGGMALLAATELLAIGARDENYPGEGTGLLDALYGVSSIAVGIGLIVTGIAVSRRAALVGWRRYVVLVAGIFVFVPLTPALLGPYVVARLAITAWMLLFAAIGYALWRTPA